MSSNKFLKCSCALCGGRIEYPADAAGMQIPCPHCSKPTNLTVEVPEADDTKPRRTFFAWLGIAIVLVLAVVTVAGPTIIKQLVKKPKPKTAAAAHTTPPTPAAARPVINNFEVHSLEIQRAAGGSLQHVTGVLRNTVDRQRFSVRIEIELLDDKETVIGATSDYVAVVEPSGEWRFRALVLKGQPTSARVARIREQ